MLAIAALALFIGLIFMPIYFTITKEGGKKKKEKPKKQIQQVLSVSDYVLFQEVFSFFSFLFQKPLCNMRQTCTKTK